MRQRILIVIIVLSSLGILCGIISLALPNWTPPVKELETKITGKLLNLSEPPAPPVFAPEDLVWKQANLSPWAARDSHSMFVFKNRLWLLGGLSVPYSSGHVSMEQYEVANYFNDIWSSEDGEHWQEETTHAAFPPLRSASIAEFNGSLWLLGGWSPNVRYGVGVWRSIDGVNWEQVVARAPWGEREGQKVLVFDNKLWLFGGVNYDSSKIYNDVWSSIDGITWEQEASINPWKPRWDHDVEVYRDRIYLVGGMGFGGLGFRDTWSTADGKTWRLETETAPWGGEVGGRQGHELVAFKDKLWLVGGLNSSTNAGVGDTWYTENGRDWQKLPNDGGWTGREDHEVVVFRDKIWLFGGMDLNWQWSNDGWFLE